MDRINSLIYRLISGKQLFCIDGIDIQFTPPTLDILGRAEFYWLELVKHARFNGWPEIEEGPQLAIECGVWSNRMEKTLQDNKDKIKESKKLMYENFMSGSAYIHFRKIIKALNQQNEELLSHKHSMDHLTTQGWANCLKNEKIVKESCSSYKPLSLSQRHKVISLINKHRILESEYRQIARDGTWLSYWATGKEKIFKTGLGELNFEQRNMCNMSRVYDNAYQSPDCPEEVVLDDPDLFQGWQIATDDNRQSESIKKEIDSKVPSSAKHVFVIENERLTKEKIVGLNNSQTIRQMKEMTNG